MNLTEESSGKRVSRSAAIICARAESPASARADAAPYSTSLSVERSSAAAAPCLAAGRFPKNPSHKAAPASQSAAIPGCPDCSAMPVRSEEHTSELQSPCNLVCRLLLEKKKHKSLPILSVLYILCLLRWSTVVAFFRFVRLRHPAMSAPVLRAVS